MAAPAYTKGPWRKGRSGAVVADHPVPGMGGSDAVEYYGGHLIAESVAPQNRDIIAAAPELYEALEMVRDADDDCHKDGLQTIPPMPRNKINRALAKALGEGKPAMKMLTIRVAVGVAKNLQHGLSDFACWARGYVSALSPDDRLYYEPMGIGEVRDLNIILKGALNDFDEGKDPVDDALTELMRTAYAASSATRDREDKTAHAVAAHLHDEIVNLKRKLKGEQPIAGSAPWPFTDRP